MKLSKDEVLDLLGENCVINAYYDLKSFDVRICLLLHYDDTYHVEIDIFSQILPQLRKIETIKTPTGKVWSETYVKI